MKVRSPAVPDSLPPTTEGILYDRRGGRLRFPHCRYPIKYVKKTLAVSNHVLPRHGALVILGRPSLAGCDDHCQDQFSRGFTTLATGRNDYGRPDEIHWHGVARHCEFAPPRGDNRATPGCIAGLPLVCVTLLTFGPKSHQQRFPPQMRSSETFPRPTLCNHVSPITSRRGSLGSLRCT